MMITEADAKAAVDLGQGLLTCEQTPDGLATLFTNAFSAHRLAERERIVAWVRECQAFHEANSQRKGQIVERAHHIDACRNIAAAIERGEADAKANPMTLHPGPLNPV